MDFVRITAPVPTFKKSFPATVQRFHKISRPEINHKFDPKHIFSVNAEVPLNINHLRSRSAHKAGTIEPIPQSQTPVPTARERKTAIDMLKVFIPNSHKGKSNDQQAQVSHLPIASKSESRNLNVKMDVSMRDIPSASTLQIPGQNRSSSMQPKIESRPGTFKGFISSLATAVKTGSEATPKDKNSRRNSSSKTAQDGSEDSGIEKNIKSSSSQVQQTVLEQGDVNTFAKRTRKMSCLLTEKDVLVFSRGKRRTTIHSGETNGILN